jgi:hypothetical protein
MTKDEIMAFAKENKVKLSVTWWDDTVWLNRIIIPKDRRGQGLGGLVIGMLKQYVSSRDIPLKLLADSCYGTEINQLMNIYRKLGFESYKEKGSKNPHYMVYYPR